MSDYRASRPAPPRLGLTKAEAAACLGLSIDSFERHVQPHLKVFRAGKLRIFPFTELEQFIADHAEQVIGSMSASISTIEPKKRR